MMSILSTKDNSGQLSTLSYFILLYLCSAAKTFEGLESTTSFGWEGALASRLSDRPSATLGDGDDMILAISFRLAYALTVFHQYLTELRLGACSEVSIFCFTWSNRGESPRQSWGLTCFLVTAGSC